MAELNEHLVSLGFSVDKKSYDQLLRTTSQIDSAVSKMADHISVRVAEAALSVVGLEKVLEKVREAVHKVVHGGKKPAHGPSEGESGEKGVLKKFAEDAGKYFGEATVAVASFALAVGDATVSLLHGLGQQEIQMEMLSRSMWTTQRQAYAFSLSLKVLGASLNDLYLSPTLLAQYEKLHAVALQMSTPGNYDTVLKSAQNLSLGFAQLQLEAYYALQWIGYYFLKYLGGPISDVQSALNQLNSVVVKKMPAWTKVVASVLASFWQAGIYVVQAIGAVLNVLQKVLNFLPGWVKALVAAGAVIGLAFKASPIVGFTLALSALILVFDDFETYLHGGKSALGAFGGVLLGLVGVFAAVKTAIVAVTFAQKLWSLAQTAAIASLYAWDVAVDVWQAVTKAATVVMAAFDAVLDANPVALIVLAVAAAVAALTFGVVELVKNWTKVQDAAQDALGWINGHVEVLAAALTGLAQEGLQALVEGFFLLKAAGVDAWNAILRVSSAVLSGMVSALNDVISVVDLLPGVHVGHLSLPASPGVAGGVYPYAHPVVPTVSTRHVHLSQTNHIHGTGSPQATADAVSRTFNRGLHNLQGVIR